MQTNTTKDRILQQNSDLTGILDHLDMMIYQAQVEQGRHRFTYVNKKIEHLTGYSLNQIREKNISWFDLIDPNDIDPVLEKIHTAVRQNTPVSIEYRIRSSDGSSTHVLDRLFPVSGEEEGAVVFDGWIIDNTERKRVQSSLERTQMLQSIGRLSAGIAHEINTPIQFIGDNIKFLSDSFGQVRNILDLYERFETLGDEDFNAGCARLLSEIGEIRKEVDLSFLVNEIPQAIEQSLEGIKRVSTMLSAMRDFSHIDERRANSVDINKVIQSTVVICRNEYKYIADILLDLDDNLPRVICCQDDINQVLLNLIINAVHSIEERQKKDKQRGTIKIRTQKHERDVVIRVQDSGTGIAPEVQEKMFEPFYTTKDAGKGTGQGLSIIKSIVEEKHKGRLEYETEIGKGTEFYIYLPVHREIQENR